MKTQSFFITIPIYVGLNFISSQCLSQNMNSPYSIYGIGDIDNRMYNKTNGMAGTGLAIKSGSSLINNNPAAISGLPRSFYMINLSAVGKTVQYSGEGINETNRQNKDFWLKEITLGVKINKFWASSIGFKQFSNVNYLFSGNKNVIGSNESYSAVYEGNGGLNDYYWTNAVSLGKHFSLGIKSSIIAGSINQTETITNDAVTNSIETRQQDYFGSPRFEYGTVYSSAINKKWDFSVGGKFINKTRLSSNRTLTVTENSTVIENDKYLQTNRFFLPETFGAGISIVHNKKTAFAADYTYENWSPLNISGNGWRLVNSSRLSAGMEFANRVTQWGQTIEKNHFQFGGFISNSYLRVHNTVVNEFGITAGMGGRLNNSLLYSISLEGGQRGTTQSSLVKENFFQFTIGLTYRDLLFSKGKKYD
jgi:hypothetical protein